MTPTAAPAGNSGRLTQRHLSVVLPAEGLANEHRGRRYPVHHLGTTVIAEDPDHSASSVDLQIGGGKMAGFVASYAATPG